MFTNMFWISGLFLDVYKDVLDFWVVSRCLQSTKMFRVAGVFLDVYEDVPGCWGVSRCVRRCSGLLGCL